MEQLISIIIPVYNRADLIKETLDSIILQSYTNWECIIVDDGSTDNTRQVLNEYKLRDSRFRYFERPKIKPKGPSSCRNYGFNLCKGKFIQFFDSDDIMHEEHLQCKMKYIGNSDFAVCKIKEFNKCFDKKLFLIDDVESIQEEENVFEAFATGQFQMMMVAPIWKFSVLKKFMPLREDLYFLEDHELYARILKENRKYKIVNKTLIYYRINSPSTTKSFYLNVENGLDSYFEAKATVLKLSNAKEIKFAILKLTLSFFRLSLAQKKYESAEKCICFIRNKKLCFSNILKMKMSRIVFFYYIFKFLGRGDTRFKFLLKL